MIDKSRIYTGKLFESIHPNNPLNRLTDDQKQTLWALLKCYQARSKTKFLNTFDEAEEMVADGAKLGARLAEYLLGCNTVKFKRDFDLNEISRNTKRHYVIFQCRKWRISG